MKAGAGTPKNDNADGANVGEVGFRVGRLSGDCQGARRAGQPSIEHAIIESLRRIGHELSASDHGWWIVRTGAL